MKQFGKVTAHLTFGVVVGSSWVALTMWDSGLFMSIIVVLGSIHLGAVMTKKWPERGTPVKCKCSDSAHFCGCNK